MKKLEKYISPSELFLSLFLVISITFTVIFSLCLKNDSEPLYENTVLSIQDNMIEGSINLGEYKARNYRYNRYYNGYTISVKSGEDFYNEVIKKNEHYDKELDFTKDDYIAYGFMWDGFTLIRYEVDRFNYVRFGFCYVLGKVTVKHNNETFDCFSTCPAPFNYMYSNEELEYEINNQIKVFHETAPNYTEEKRNSDKEYYRDLYTKCNDYTFDELKRIYNNPNSNYYKVTDDCILIKARTYNNSMEHVITEDYYAKIINDNGVARIYKINNDRELSE